MEKELLSRKDLYDLVWTQPLLTLAKKYQISDVGLRKACIRMNIPTPRVGYWQKLQFGKNQKKIPLPGNHSGMSELTLLIRDENNPGR